MLLGGAVRNRSIRIMSRKSNRTLPLGGLLLGLLVFSLVGTVAAGPSGPMAPTSGRVWPGLARQNGVAERGASLVSDGARRQFSAAAPANSETAIAGTCAVEGLRGVSPGPGWWAVMTAGRGVENFP